MTEWAGPRCGHGREFCIECHSNHHPLKPMPGGPAEQIQKLEQRITELEALINSPNTVELKRLAGIAVGRLRQSGSYGLATMIEVALANLEAKP